MRLVIVSYAFPPVGGAGVQRVLKFAKYLPSFGVAPTVLTAENPSVPVADETLLADVPPGVQVVRARTLEPDYKVKAAVWRNSTASAGGAARIKRALSKAARGLFVPDPQILWLPAAAPALRRLSADADAVLVSGPPFSPFLLTLIARAPVILDYRDEWRTAAGYEMGSRLSRGAADTLEPILVRRAAAIITATEEFRQNLLARYPDLDPSRVVAIPNGYDPDDFAGIAAAPAPLPFAPGRKFVVTYAGTIFRLTSPRGLMEGVRLLHARRPELAKYLELRFAGRVVDTEQPSFEGTEALGVRHLGYLSHGDAIKALAESHMVLCLLDDVPGAESIYPAKIFELMHLGRPCLAIAPPGALTRLCERHRLGVVAHPKDPEAIARVLEDAISAWQRGEPLTGARPEGVEAYHRRALAGRLAETIRGVA